MDLALGMEKAKIGEAELAAASQIARQQSKPSRHSARHSHNRQGEQVWMMAGHPIHPISQGRGEEVEEREAGQLCRQ